MPKITKNRLKSRVAQQTPLLKEYLDKEQIEEEFGVNNNEQQSNKPKIGNKALEMMIRKKKKTKKDSDDEKEDDNSTIDLKMYKKIEEAQRNLTTEDDLESTHLQMPNQLSSDNNNEDKLVEIELNEEEQQALNFFLNEDENRQNINISNVIAKNIQEKAKEANLQFNEEDLERKLNNKVVTAYRAVGKVLSTYRSGKFPKIFAVIPQLENWEEIIYLTHPDQWTTQALYKAVGIFASQSNEQVTQRFYNMILLPRIRNNILEENSRKKTQVRGYKRTTKQHLVLNHHLYQAMFKAIYRPAPFFKGIILPLCEENDFSFKEAYIMGGLLKKISIPILHSAAALMRILQLDFSSPRCMIIKSLIDKRYALPTQVIQAVVKHFTHFMSVNLTQELPSIWFQTLLDFVEYYNFQLSHGQRKHLKELVKVHKHYSMSPQIRKILNAKPQSIPQHKSKYEKPSGEAQQQDEDDDDTEMAQE
ncbi:hypothetical protein ABK040_004851 [Willaertia magna]